MRRNILRSMKASKSILFVMCFATLLGCNKVNKQQSADEHDDCCPLSELLVLQPYDNVKQKDLESTKDKVQDFLKRYDPVIYIEVPPAKQLPKSLIYKKRNRYWAGAVLTYMGKTNINNDPEYTTIGVTDKDISTTTHNVYNYGIMGQSILNGHVGIVSTYRVSKPNLWKIVLHEFLHTKGLKHCRDKACMMCEGGKNLDMRTKLCAEHNKQLINKIGRTQENN